MINRLPHIPLLLCSLCLAISSGCSGSDFDARVSGTVTLDDKAVGPGFLVFVPVDGERNPANGAIQPDGSYELKTANADGLHPGKYKVSVTVLDQPDVPPGERSYLAAKSRIPERYNDVSTSGLEFDVQSGDNSLDIPLLSK